MIIHINSYPGVGKLTIALELQRLIGGKLLDNHSIYNVALALCEPKSTDYYSTIRAVRNIAYARVLELPEKTPIILTNAHASSSEWGQESWREIRKLASSRMTPLYSVVLRCDPDENARRISTDSRQLARKPTDPNMFPGNRDGVPLLEGEGAILIAIDVTQLSAREAAEAIRSQLMD